MRTPRLWDAHAWSEARLANRAWLEGAFPAWGAEWAAEQSVTAWVERWWYLRTAARRDGARPFVVLLDGELIGELGVDAVDRHSSSGEVSVWMIRNHGSAAVMNVASLLLAQHAFSGTAALDRLVSPVATSSRAGRSPGLRAVGLEIEATIPRAVGPGEPVDHDIWVLHNTERVRSRVGQLLQAGTVPSTDESERPVTARRQRSARSALQEVVVVVTAVARAAVRAARTSARGSARLQDPSMLLGSHLVRDTPVTVNGAGATTFGGVDAGRLVLRHDRGTATLEIHPGTVGVDDPAVAGAAISIVTQAARVVAPGVRFVDVRAALDGSDQPPAVASTLPIHGFVLAAIHPPNPEAASPWAGEQRWRYEVTD